MTVRSRRAAVVVVSVVVWGLLGVGQPAGAETHDSFAYAIGDTVSDGVPAAGAGNLEEPGSTDTYTFTADAGDRVYFDRLSCAVAGGCGARWMLSAPDSSVLFNLFLIDVGPVVLPTAGTYTLVVSSWQGNTGTYSFTTNLTIDESFPYAIGDTVSDGVPAAGAGNLEVPGATDTYTFNADAGDRVYFSRLSCAVAGGCNARWSLIGPDDAELFNQFFIDVGPVVLPTAGTYTLVVSSAAGNTGTYSFTTNLTIDESFPYAIGDTVSDGVPAAGAGNLEVPGATDTYTFTADAGDSVYFDRLSCDVTGGCNARWSLIGPDDSVLFNQFFIDVGPVVLPTAGTYTLVVSSAAGNTGTYSFTTQLEGGAIAGTVTDGDGLPFEGVVVTAVISGDASVLYTDVTGADGTYEIDGLPVSGDYVVHFDAGTYGTCYDDVTCQIFGSTPVAVASGLVTSGINQMLVAPTGGSMAGTVADNDSNPVADALVWVVRSGWDPVSIVRTDTSGDWSATGLPAGDYSIVVLSGGASYCYTSPMCSWFAPATPLAEDEDLTGIDFTID